MLREKYLLLVWLLMFCLTGCSGAMQQEEALPQQEESAIIDTDHVLYKHFSASYEDKTPLLTGVNDINNDGREDLIVIYQDTADTNKMVAIWEEEGNVITSEPTPAPQENYRLEWRDIDKKPPTELVVSGSKGVNVGYAIYRWENGDFLNLFGDGMEDCC